MNDVAAIKTVRDLFVAACDLGYLERGNRGTKAAERRARRAARKLLDGLLGRAATDAEVNAALAWRE